MLVLSRKQWDSIVIDGNIKVTVVEVKGTVVRLGIESAQGSLDPQVRASRAISRTCHVPIEALVGCCSGTWTDFPGHSCVRVGPDSLTR